MDDGFLNANIDNNFSKKESFKDKFTKEKKNL